MHSLRVNKLLFISALCFLKVLLRLLLKCNLSDPAKSTNINLPIILLFKVTCNSIIACDLDDFLFTFVSAEILCDLT